MTGRSSIGSVRDGESVPCSDRSKMVKAIVAAWSDRASTRTLVRRPRLLPLLKAQGIDVRPVEVGALFTVPVLIRCR